MCSDAKMLQNIHVLDKFLVRMNYLDNIGNFNLILM